MRKQLSVTFTRLFRSKILWLGVAGVFVFAVINMLSQSKTIEYPLWDGTMASASSYKTMDKSYMFFASFIGFFGAVFAGLFLGSEYGSFRNKVSVGSKRSDIYIANFLAVYTATLLGVAAWLIGALAGLFTLGPWADVPALMKNLLISVLFIAALSAIFTLIGMLCANRAVVVALSAVLVFGTLLGSAAIDQSLSAEEMSPGGGIWIEQNDDGTVEWGESEPQPNPYYISGVKRSVYEFIHDFLPTGQEIQVSVHGGVKNLPRAALSSVAITLLVTAAGIVFFRRKDLK